MPDGNISENLLIAIKRMNDAADRSAGERSPCNMVAVSKTQPTDKIEEALAAGQRIFGENRVQEAELKWPALKERHPDIELHLIGGLQTNKVKLALALFDVIQTLDRPKLARAISREVEAGTKAPRLFVQVNTGEEPQKGGVNPGDLESLLSLCRDELGLQIEGLMCIPPTDDEPALHFALLDKLAYRHGLKNLSIGMSADFELAAEMGASHVRVGTAIFGDRNPAP